MIDVCLAGGRVGTPSVSRLGLVNEPVRCFSLLLAAVPC